jgi:hypothetical protein
LVISQLALSADGADLLGQQADLFVRRLCCCAHGFYEFIALCLQIPQLVDIVRIGNQKSNGDALAAITACVVSPASLRINGFSPFCGNAALGLPPPLHPLI